MMKVQLREDSNKDKSLWFDCPGCGLTHEISVENNSQYKRPVWYWNKDIDSPTIQPSLMVKSGHKGRNGICHSFITDGKIKFLSDCTHKLAGQTVDMETIT